MPKTYGTPGPRVLYPDCCTSQSLAECSMGAQLLFDRLIVQSDDQGRQQGDPAIVKAVCFPYFAEATPKRIAGWMGELERSGMVTLYASGKASLVQLTGWWSYQAGMRRAYPSRWPAPDGWMDRVFGLGKGEGGETPPDRGQPAGNPPQTAPDFPPRARGSGASAYAGADASASASAVSSARGGGEPDEPYRTLEELTDHFPVQRVEQNAIRTLDALCDRRGVPAVIAALRAEAPGIETQPPSPWQLIAAARNRLEPFANGRKQVEAIGKGGVSAAEANLAFGLPAEGPAR